jgi:ankyrin repeat protein
VIPRYTSANIGIISYRDDLSNPVNWSGLSQQFEECESDTLFLIDSCAAAMATPQETANNKIEVIAACGVENIAFADGELNFTNQLREALEEMRKEGGTFSAVMLHSRVFQRIRELAGNFDKKRKSMVWQTGRTPTHFLLTNDPTATSIELHPLVQEEAFDYQSSSQEDKEMYFAVDADGKYPKPHVLINMYLQDEDFSMNGVASFAQWLRDFPMFASSVKVEAAYDSYSSVLLLSLPLAVWLMIEAQGPPNVSFVNYITSTNRYRPKEKTPSPNLLGERLGRTPLSLAAARGHEQVVMLLLESGAELDDEDSEGTTPLSLAIANGHEAVVKLLLEKGAKLDYKDSDGKMPLLLAAANGHEAVVKLLLESGAELDDEDSEGTTPLSLAAANGHEGIVKLLLEKGAKLDSEDSDGKTPLSLAAAKGHEAVVKLLLEKGAEVDSKDSDGQTPLSMAAAEGHKAVVELLLEKGAYLGRLGSRKRVYSRFQKE